MLPVSLRALPAITPPRARRVLPDISGVVVQEVGLGRTALALKPSGETAAMPDALLWPIGPKAGRQVSFTRPCRPRIVKPERRVVSSALTPPETVKQGAPRAVIKKARLVQTARRV